METYIVMIDTTFAQKLGKSIQNFGFCLATDVNNARERFILPLKGKISPHILGELFSYVYAYKLDDITGQLSESNPVWSYICTSASPTVGQQSRTPFLTQSLKAVDSTPAAPVAPSAPIAPAPAEFKPPEGVTDPVQIALLKTVFDLTQEVKGLKSQPAGGAAKPSIDDLESRFRAPQAVGEKGIDPRLVTVPEVAGVTVIPRGQLDMETKQRIRSNIVRTRLEDADDMGGFNSGTN
jgi:hypothetical protein